jgi:tetratricopeptide (TPR) repeat protein
VLNLFILRKVFWVIVGVACLMVGGRSPRVLAESPLIAQGRLGGVITPTTPAAREKMAQGLQFLQQGQLTEGIARLREAIALDPTLWEAHYNLGLAQQQGGNLQAAAQAFYDTVTLKPDFAPGYANIGGILADTRNWGQAQTYLQQAIALDPNLAIAHYNLGLVHRRTGRLADAIQAWETALRLAPDLSIAAIQLTEAYLDGDRPKEAKTLIQQLLQTNNRLVAVHYLNGRLADTEGKPDAALQAFRQASQLDPNYANAYLASAQILMQNGRTQAAIPLLDYALLLYNQQKQTAWAQFTQSLRQQIR